MGSISTVKNHEGGIVATNGKAPLLTVEPGSLFSRVLQNPVPNRDWDNKFRGYVFYTLLDSSLLCAVVLLMRACILKVKGQ